MSVDPLADKYPNVTPYLYCNGNPVMLVDPDGRDWYDADGEIKWTDCKSQEAMDKAKINGRYLGEAVVIAEGSMSEKLGLDNKLDGEGATPAKISIYGINGKDDIQTYNGLTVTSDPDRYSMISPGDYLLKQEQMPTSVFANDAKTYHIFKRDGNNPGVLDTADGEINKHYPNQGATIIGGFFHRTNWNGNAYGDPAKGRPVSCACIVIDGRQWKNVEKQLGNSQNIFMRLTRTK